MRKLLSICIPSYNMEKYLSRNLDSFLDQDSNDALELIVVNDGSKDRTLHIANEYQSKYPETILVIDKPNGHYGSCINAALKVATGKYFRIVDADDWVDTAALKTVMKELSQIDTDVVYTKYSVFEEKDNKTLEVEDPFDFIPWGESIRINDVVFDKYVHMHQITYKLDFLKRINYIQTEGVCYTDTEYVYIPIIQAQTFYGINISLYQYYVGREDQSMNVDVLVRNFTHLHKVLSRIVSYDKPKSANHNFVFLRKCYIDVFLHFMIDALFACHCKNEEWNNLLRAVMIQLKTEGYDLTQYWQIKFKGCPWVKWLYENDSYSRIKLTTMFYVLRARMALLAK